MIGYIYKYENKINHKVYIGQTTNLAMRMCSHVSKAKTNKRNKFYNAVRKYGWEEFDYSIIAQVEADSIEELTVLLDYLEIQYIEQYNSYKDGYNSTLGGHSFRESQMPEGFSEECRKRAKAYPRERIEKLLAGRRKYVLTEEHRKRLSDVAKERNFAAYREKYLDKLIENRRKAHIKQVLQVDKEGNVVNVFPSIQDAALYIIANYAPDRALMGIWKGLYRHFNKITKKRLYYGFEWKLGTNV